MWEIEVKVLEIDPQAVVAKLTALGAVCSFSGEMHARFFDTQDGTITREKGVFRLRKAGAQTRLTHKRNISRSGAKIMEELETEVGDLETTTQIFLALGYRITDENHKHRTQYDLENSHVVIDDYRGDLAHIPCFMEIESPDMETLYHLLGVLGHKPEEALSWSTAELVQHYAQGAEE